MSEDVFIVDEETGEVVRVIKEGKCTGDLVAHRSYLTVLSSPSTTTPDVGDKWTGDGRIQDRFVAP